MIFTHPFRMCFYESEFVKGFASGNPSRSSLYRSLLGSIQQANCVMPVNSVGLNQQSCFNHVPLSVGLSSKMIWQLQEAVRNLPHTSFYPCWSQTRHPILYSLEARKAFQERPLLDFGPLSGNPHEKTGRSHQLRRKKQKQSHGCDQAAFSWAPSGKTPSST